MPHYSILAHRDQSITSNDWRGFHDREQAALIPLLENQTRTVGLKMLAPQLPQHPFWRQN